MGNRFRLREREQSVVVGPAEYLGRDAGAAWATRRGTWDEPLGGFLFPHQLLRGVDVVRPRGPR